MLLWVIANFKLRPLDKVIVITQESDQIQSKIANYLKYLNFDVRFKEINGITSGPASTVDLVVDQLQEDLPVVVVNSDQYISEGLEAFTQIVRTAGAGGAILTMSATGSKWSYVGRDADGIINKVVEKQEISREATVGVYAWCNPQLLKNCLEFVFHHGERVNNEYYVAPSFEYLIKNHMEIKTYSVGVHGEQVHGLGTPDDLSSFLENPRFPEFRSQISHYFAPK